MVGGFVEDQDVGLLDGQAAEHQARGFSARERRKGLGGVVSAEEHQAQLPAHIADVPARAGVPDPVLGGAPRFVELLLVVLGEVADVRFVSPADGSGVGGHLAERDLEQGGFADAVGAEDGQPIAAADAEVDAVEHLVVAERLADALGRKYLASAGADGLEAERGVAARAAGEGLERCRLLLDEPQLALRLACLAGLGTESVHELLVVRDLPVAADDLLLAAFVFGALALLEGAVVPGIGEDGFVVDIEDVGDDVVEKTVVVGDHHQRTLEVAHELLEPADGKDVEVVGGLVEQERIGSASENLGEEYAQPESAGKGRERIAVAGGGKAQSLEDGRGSGFRGVAVVSLDNFLETREAVRVEFPARLDVREQRLAGRQRVP